VMQERAISSGIDLALVPEDILDPKVHGKPAVACDRSR
jgi:hypothetical protein